MIDQLKPCPFCGGSNVREQVEFTVGDVPLPAVYCRTCGAVGPACERLEHAAPNWNARKRNWVKCSERKPGKDGHYNIVVSGIDCYGCRRDPEMEVCEWRCGSWLGPSEDFASRVSYIEITHWLDEGLELPEDV